MDITTITTYAQSATDLLAPCLPALTPVLDGAAKEFGKIGAVAGLDKAKAVWAALKGAPNSAPMQDAAKTLAERPDDRSARDAFALQVLALMAANAALTEQVARLMAEGGGNSVTASGAGSVAIGGDVRNARITTNVGR